MMQIREKYMCDAVDLHDLWSDKLFPSCKEFPAIDYGVAPS